MQRVHRHRRLDGAGTGDERLRGHLAAEHPLQQGVGLGAAEEVEVDRLEVEQLHELVS